MTIVKLNSLVTVNIKLPLNGSLQVLKKLTDAASNNNIEELLAYTTYCEYFWGGGGGWG